MSLSLRAQLFLRSLALLAPVSAAFVALLRAAFGVPLLPLAALAAIAALGAAGLLAAAGATAVERELDRLAGAVHGHGAVPLEDQAFSGVARSLDRARQTIAAEAGALREERDLLARVIDGLTDGLLVIDRQGVIARANPAAERMLGLAGSPVGRTVAEACRHARLLDLVAHVRRTGASADAELPLPPRSLQLRAAPAADGAAVVLIADITEGLRLDQVRRDFVANASHELRTPVTALASAAETLRTALADPAAALTFVEIIERNAERLQRLVGDLLDLSRIEARAAALLPEPVPLEPVVGQVLVLFKERAERRRIRLATRGLAGVTVLADRRALERALSNLVDNAVKYTRDGSEVAVAAERLGGAVRISVVDQGPGLEARHLPRLFERFYRADPGRARELGGTGLGLSIVRNLVEAMGGSVEVQSEVGKGSVFGIRLPAPPAEQSGAAALERR